MNKLRSFFFFFFFYQKLTAHRDRAPVAMIEGQFHAQDEVMPALRQVH